MSNLRVTTNVTRRKSRMKVRVNAIEKASSGIKGLDEITGGGLPKGRPTLVCGGPGCGKTLFALEFLVRGATEHNEPGVFVAFEETSEELTQNVASLGFDLGSLIRDGMLHLDYVQLDGSEIEETGEFDLEGLFIRLGYAIDTLGAKRVVLDTIEALFSAIPNEFKLRSELIRLFRWLKEKGVTAVITAERGGNLLTRHGLEEYVADCVILLDNRVEEQIATRLLRIVKYRGSLHGTNEYPFLIDELGFSVLPITSISMDYVSSEERVSSGILSLDAMLQGKGFFRGTSILLSGTVGTGKSSVAANFVDAACRRGEKAIYFAFEESEGQIIRNVRSIGIDLQRWVDKGLLEFHASRPTVYGLERHLLNLYRRVNEFGPDVAVLDSLSAFDPAGPGFAINLMLMRSIDFFKHKKITSLFTNLIRADLGAPESTDVEVSSLMDTWILLRNIEQSGERNRGLQVLKSRGMSHSNQVREFVMTNRGVDLLEVYTGPGGVLTGSARIAQEGKDRAAALLRQQETERNRSLMQRKHEVMDSQIAILRAQFQNEEDESMKVIEQDRSREAVFAEDRATLAHHRQADSSVSQPKRNGREGKKGRK
jgi:circadian clock protein KaiC